ncbi:MAG: ferritin family protein [Deltaproteobacteria bacterium]|nr:ferritin family protein [Candidatus Zymogenaceae bacterium]
MAEIFNIDEVFEIAEQIERNGAQFYRKAAALFETSRAKSLLMDLAAMEDRHEKIFKELRQELKKKAGKQDSYIDDEPAQYLKAVAGGCVFPINTDPSERLKADESLQDVLHFAIEIEKDSIVFYLGVREAMPEELGRLDISQIIKEEMRHITFLSDMLHKI